MVKSENSPSPLVGSGISIDDAIKGSTAICVGTLKSRGDGPSADAPGEANFQNAEITIQDSLKGSLSGDIKVDYSVKGIIRGEISPTVNTVYIYFITGSNANQYQVIKLLAATTENISNVRGKLATQQQ